MVHATQTQIHHWQSRPALSLHPCPLYYCTFQEYGPSFLLSFHHSLVDLLIPSRFFFSLVSLALSEMSLSRPAFFTLLFTTPALKGCIFSLCVPSSFHPFLFFWTPTKTSFCLILYSASLSCPLQKNNMDCFYFRLVSDIAGERTGSTSRGSSRSLTTTASLPRQQQHWPNVPRENEARWHSWSPTSLSPTRRHTSITYRSSSSRTWTPSCSSRPSQALREDSTSSRTNSRANNNQRSKCRQRCP